MEEQQRIEIGHRIRELREASPQTNRSIADYVGVGERAVANWIGGSTGIEYEHAKRVAALFEVEVQWLWAGERTQTPDLGATFSGTMPDALQAQLDRMEGMLKRLLGEQDEPGDEEGGSPDRPLRGPADPRSAKSHRLTLSGGSSPEADNG